jgi:uncharacterized protein YyaL (SSP411 family)
LYFTVENSPLIVVRKKETLDNVIPSSNAVMAEVLLALSEYFVEPRYREKAEAMLAAIRGEFPDYSPAYSRWADLLFLEERAATFVVTGPDAVKLPSAAGRRYLPHLRLAGADPSSNLPLLAGRLQPGASLAYRCEHGACGLPTADWKGLLAAESIRIIP